MQPNPINSNESLVVTIRRAKVKMHYMQPTFLRPKFAAPLVALVATLLAAAAPDESPDAVVVNDATPQLMVTLYPALAKLGQPPVLITTAQNNPYVEQYLTQIAARRVWFVDPSNRLPQDWIAKFHRQGPSLPTSPLDIVQRTWPKPPAVILVDDRNSTLRWAAALLGAARQIPAICVNPDTFPAIAKWILSLNDTKLYCIGSVPFAAADWPNTKITRFAELDDVLDAYDAALEFHDRPPDQLLAIGVDPTASATKLSDLLVPQYAIRHRAAIAVLDSTQNLDSQLQPLLADRYPSVRYVTLWGDVQSLPDEQVPDPVAAAGLETKLTEQNVAVPPLSGLKEHKVCRYRVGRITGENAASVSLVIARNLRPPERPRDTAPTALIMANTDGDLPIMEAITRTTAQTLERTGWNVRANYGWEATWYKRFGPLWGADLVLYEGHTGNLSRSVPVDYENDPIIPGLYIFQGCKTLRQPEVSALLRNGAEGVIGTTTNTYSASGSALAKVIVDSLILDSMDAGTSLMVARNFMLALSDLKERRGHEQGPKIMRGGMTFSLWGDPTWKTPAAPKKISDGEIVRARIKGKQIELSIPDTFEPPVSSGEYGAVIPIGAKLAGMYEESDERSERQLPPLYFAIVPLPTFDGDQGPNITTAIARNRWTSVWDPQNRWLYLLVQSNSRNEHDRGRRLVFHATE